MMYARERGEVSEWPKEHAWKACVRVTVPRVRIPPSPFTCKGCSSSRFGLPQPYLFLPFTNLLAELSRYELGTSSLLSQNCPNPRSLCVAPVNMGCFSFTMVPGGVHISSARCDRGVPARGSYPGLAAWPTWPAEAKLAATEEIAAGDRPPVRFHVVSLHTPVQSSSVPSVTMSSASPA